MSLPEFMLKLTSVSRRGRLDEVQEDFDLDDGVGPKTFVVSLSLAIGGNGDGGDGRSSRWGGQLFIARPDRPTDRA